MDGLSAANEAYGSQTIAPSLQSLLSCLGESGISGQTKVVVRAKIKNAFATWNAHVRALRGCENAFVFEEATFSNVIEFGLQVLKKGLARHAMNVSPRSGLAQDLKWRRFGDAPTQQQS